MIAPENELKSLLLEGLDSPVREWTDEDWDDLRRVLRKRLAQKSIGSRPEAEPRVPAE